MFQAYYLLVLGLVGLSYSSSDHPWSYTGDTGPDYWDGVCATGQKQSPINLSPDAAGYDSSLNSNPLTFSGYDSTPAQGSWVLTNNGHSVMVDLPDQYSISGGPLPGTYKAKQFHMHWGSQDDRGSEHTFVGKQYSAEIHIVHYSDQYSFEDAVGQTDGLAVIGIMVEVGGANNTDLAPFFNALPSVKLSGATTTNVTPFSLQSLIPDLSSTWYYTYRGSLTTPPCSETVIWTVIKMPLQISAAQMAALRAVKDAAGNPLVDNFRPVMPVNGRNIRANI